MKKLVLLFLFVVFLGLPFGVHAQEPPNNIYGIHVTNIDDLDSAAELVNSSGGEWGYVTVVIPENERNKNHWQEFFDKARRLKLIPIVRIASRSTGGIWEKPAISEIDNWVSFLDSLNWVVKDRYVIIGNEPNHAKEWGGAVNPEEYAEYLEAFATKLKARNSDFFVMAAGLDASASTEYVNKRTGVLKTLDEAEFLRKMIAVKPQVFDNIDGLSSHSYPNPAFSGPANGSGRGSVRTYEWELEYLKQLGIAKELPVFITETGWSQKINGTPGLSETEISERIKFTFEEVWSKDKRIKAVTPFILNYTHSPFNNFSWKKQDGTFYNFYYQVKSLSKIKGEPEQIKDGQIRGVFMLPVHAGGSTFSGFAFVKNTGQSIWEGTDVGLVDGIIEIKTKNTSYAYLEPDRVGTIFFEAKAPEKNGIYTIEISLSEKDQKLGKKYFSKIIVDDSLSVKLISVFGKILDTVRDNLTRFQSTLIGWF